jgi:hypothetical protein
MMTTMKVGQRLLSRESLVLLQFEQSGAASDGLDPGQGASNALTPTLRATSFAAVTSPANSAI